MGEKDNKKFIPIVAGIVVVLLAGGIGYWLWSQKEKSATGAVGAAGKASEAVPEIQTNPGQKVPEINPLDRANPFKYNNPLK